MIWKLWLDDQAHDPDHPERHAPEGFLVAHSAEEALALVREHGLPAFMDLDHDLGTSDTMEFIKKLPEMFEGGPVPDFRLHTENPVGRDNMISYLNSWKKVCESDKILTVHKPTRG